MYSLYNLCIVSVLCMSVSPRTKKKKISGSCHIISTIHREGDAIDFFYGLMNNIEAGSCKSAP